MLSENPQNPNFNIASDQVLSTDSWVNTPLSWVSNNIIYYDLRYTYAEFVNNRWYPAFSEWNVTDSTCAYDW